MQQPEFALQSFSGPLDLLLHLISKNKISIYDIPIAEILDQYLAYLDQMKGFDADIASAFAEMAAQLLLIKSRMLLPREPADLEEDPRDDLVRALLEYRAYQATTEFFHEHNKTWEQVFVKPPEELEKGTYEVAHTLTSLMEAVNALLDRQERARPVDIARFADIVHRETVSVSSKVAQILEKFAGKKRLLLYDIYRENATKSEFVAVFLALLELCKSRRITLCEGATPMDAAIALL